jgi:glycosyltransferase involved in cell wall biosynthesis
MIFTIFTPTHNRAYIIEELYKSLLIQTFNDFEWVIVDDGSTDNTEVLISKFINEKKIEIKYIKQENGGKHRAVNRGLREAQGQLFFIVDSDDRLYPNSLFLAREYYLKIKDNPEVAGIVGLKCYSNGRVTGTPMQQDEIICTNFDYRYKYKIAGDRAEIIKTEIFKQYSFPEINGEKFIAESVVWNRIGQNYTLLYFSKPIYECEYLTDGLSNASVKNRMKCPQGACLLYQELSTCNVLLKIKLKAVVNYWRFRFCIKNKPMMAKKVNPFLSILAFPIALVVHIKDKRK